MRMLMRRSLRSSVSARAGWTVADQALSSLSNLVLTALVARTSSPHVFGIFGLAFAGYVAVLGMSRALATEPLVVRFGMKSADHVAMEAGPAAGSAAAVGLIGTLAFAVCAFATDGESRVVLALFAAAVPFLLIQDAWRFVFIASRVPRRALENDGIWVLAEVLVLAPIAVAG